MLGGFFSGSFAFDNVLLGFQPLRDERFFVLALVPNDFGVTRACVTARLCAHMSSRASTSSEVQRSIMFGYTLLLCLLW